MTLFNHQSDLLYVILKCGHTALMEAARANNVPILEALLDAGADPSACDKVSNTRKHTLLGIDDQFLVCLLGNCNDMMLFQFERTALSIATGRGHKEATLLLSSATAAFSTGTTWLYPHLSQDGLTATTITRCEKILVYEQCITSARIFAKISPEIMTHSYLSDIGINTLGTQVVLINFHRECVKAAHQKKERAALKRATAAGKLQDKRLIKTLGFIGTIASCVLLLVALCLLLKIYHIF